MKKFKRLSAILSIAILVIAFLTCFVACNDKNTPQKSYDYTLTVGENYVLITTAENTGKAKETTSTTGTIKATYVHELLTELKNQKNLVYELTMGDFGAYLSKIGKIAPSANSKEFISIYHNMDDLEFKAVGFDGCEITFNEKTFFSSNVGVSTLPLKDGASYLFKIAVSTF